MGNARYRIVPVIAPAPAASAPSGKDGKAKKAAVTPRARTFLRAENEDDDGYDPYSDRPADADPADAEDPWR